MARKYADKGYMTRLALPRGKGWSDDLQAPERKYRPRSAPNIGAWRFRRVTRRKGISMNTEQTNTATAIPKKETAQPDFVKRIGKTTYKVNVHFSATSKETMSDKIKRLLRCEAGRM
jgi:hypothetical protein